MDGPVGNPRITARPLIYSNIIAGLDPAMMLCGKIEKNNLDIAHVIDEWVAKNVR